MLPLSLYTYSTRWKLHISASLKKKEISRFYTFTAEYVHPIELTGAVLDGEDLRLEGTIELVMNTGSACQPYQRWVVVRLDKLSVSSVSFQINYKTVLF